MSDSLVVRAVDFCTRHTWAVVIVAAVFAAGAGGYARRHFSLNIDISNLISSRPPWRQRELVYEKVFPDSVQSILAVVQAPTPELATEAGSGRATREQARSVSIRRRAGRRRILRAQQPLVPAPG
jgi:uncharacterized protein